MLVVMAKEVATTCDDSTATLGVGMMPFRDVEAVGGDIGLS